MFLSHCLSIIMFVCPLMLIFTVSGCWCGDVMCQVWFWFGGAANSMEWSPSFLIFFFEISLQPSLTWGHLWWCHGNMLHKFAAQWDQVGLIDSPLSASFSQASLRWAAGTPCPSITWQMLQRQRLLICCWMFTTWSRYASSYRGKRPWSILKNNGTSVVSWFRRELSANQ